jgi:hypothetical protein
MMGREARALTSAAKAQFDTNDCGTTEVVPSRSWLGRGTRAFPLMSQARPKWCSPLTTQNSKYPPAAARRDSVPVGASTFPGSNPATPLRFSQAASVSAGSEPTRSRIICQAARFNAPSGGGPIASDTEHCGQKQIRCADDFWRGLMPTVCENMYTAAYFCPAASSRLQRRQYWISKVPAPQP